MARLMASLLVALCAACGGGAKCSSFLGTYKGTLSGNSPFNGSLTLLVENGNYAGPDVNGTWNGEDGRFGEIDLAYVDCTTGAVTNGELAFSLKGPPSAICPPPCAPTSSEPGCYCTGLTLGTFAGTLKPSGGGGTWQANSGAAQYMKTTGAGTWTVNKL